MSSAPTPEPASLPPLSPSAVIGFEFLLGSLSQAARQKQLKTGAGYCSS